MLKMATTCKISALGRQNIPFMLRAYCTNKNTGQSTPKASSAGSSKQQYHNKNRTYGASGVTDLAFFDREVEALKYRQEQPKPKKQ
ncbi:hypothetical protein KUTeg_023855 [Tegillarca granosa]|uniref:Uncharacterized protein n=1 Tax=Tegillarca granosa TaxID=220873 RepID=A0ABQ9E3S8_TEGGR|nr:hypothetical protein KUTeg_023855 [Tegillarca granosa]